LNLRPLDLTASRRDLEAALRKDPGLAEGYAALALNYQIAAQFGLDSRELAIQKSGSFAAMQRN
jgi:hypothetical protein